VTGECPSMLMFGRKVRTRLDLLKEFGGRKEDQNKHFKGKREVEFEEGEMCFARDYKNPNKRSWKKGIVEEVLGKRIYLVRVLEDNVVWKRHLDQMIKSGDFYRNPDENVEYESNQNSVMKEQLSDVLEEEVVEEKLDSVLGDDTVGTPKGVEMGRCERRPGLRRNIKKVVRLDL